MIDSSYRYNQEKTTDKYATIQLFATFYRHKTYHQLRLCKQPIPTPKIREVTNEYHCGEPVTGIAVHP